MHTILTGVWLYNQCMVQYDTQILASLINTQDARVDGALFIPP